MYNITGIGLDQWFSSIFGPWVTFSKKSPVDHFALSGTSSTTNLSYIIFLVWSILTYSKGKNFQGRQGFVELSVAHGNFQVDHWWSTWTTLRITGLDCRKLEISQQR